MVGCKLWVMDVTMNASREGKMSIKKKILAGKPLTTEELGEWLIESISEWTEEEKAAARDVLLKDWLTNMPCSSTLN